jgi:hypothetical protein
MSKSSCWKTYELSIDNVQKESLKDANKHAYIDFILISDFKVIRKFE